jgi:hypothetical protein
MTLESSEMENQRNRKSCTFTELCRSRLEDKQIDPMVMNRRGEKCW